MFNKILLKNIYLTVFVLLLFVSNSLFSQGQSKFVPNKNVISVHISDILYTDFLLSYEHKTPTKDYGIYFPIAYSFGKIENIFGLNSTFYTGFGIHYYFADQFPLFFYTGPELHLGMASVENPDYLNQNTINRSQFFYTRVLMNGGFRYSPAKNSSILVKLGAGIQYADFPNVTVYTETYDGKLIKNPDFYKEKVIHPIFNFSIGFGLSF